MESLSIIILLYIKVSTCCVRSYSHSAIALVWVAGTFIGIPCTCLMFRDLTVVIGCSSWTTFPFTSISMISLSEIDQIYICRR